MAVGQLLEEAGFLEARRRLDGGVEGLDVGVGDLAREADLGLRAHADLVPLAPLAGHLDGVRRALDVLVRELDGDLVLAGGGGQVGHGHGAVLVVVAGDLSLARAFHG